MKGVLLSLVALLLNMIGSAVAAHLLRPKRHLYLFAISSISAGLLYVGLFLATPADLYCLSPAWMIRSPRLDLVYGLILFFLNCHSFVDCFFATCGGFSVSLLVAILKQGKQSPTTDDLRAKFKLPSSPATCPSAPGMELVDAAQTLQQSNRIYAWRISHLVKRGYLACDATTQHYLLTRKGRLIAVITATLKRLMNLGEGG